MIAGDPFSFLRSFSHFRNSKFRANSPAAQNKCANKIILIVVYFVIDINPQICYNTHMSRNIPTKDQPKRDKLCCDVATIVHLSIGEYERRAQQGGESKTKLRFACLDVANACNHPQLGELVYLALTTYRNDAEAWALDVLKK